MTEPGNAFFAVTFNSPEELAQFSFQVTNAIGGPIGLVKATTALPPIVFVAPMVKTGIGAYVSVGAAQLLKLGGSQFAIDATPVDLADLPNGLSLLAGDQSDLIRYQKRNPPR